MYSIIQVKNKIYTSTLEASLFLSPIATPSKLLRDNHYLDFVLVLFMNFHLDMHQNII